MLDEQHQWQLTPAYDLKAEIISLALEYLIFLS